jgi:hypothetical protein
MFGHVAFFDLAGVYFRQMPLEPVANDECAAGDA